VLLTLGLGWALGTITQAGVCQLVLVPSGLMAGVEVPGGVVAGAWWSG
jgi:hypothetical protein